MRSLTRWSDLGPPNRSGRWSGQRSHLSPRPAPHARESGSGGISAPPPRAPAQGGGGETPKSFRSGCRIGFKGPVTDGQKLLFEKCLNRIFANRLALTTRGVTEGSFNLDGR